ncbi:tyrosine-type recombinase/integrase [Endozoicomonas acroporae]|uniref:site-specific integrase n=1 Tax=Endozoicomonas acroporae TaxID=1701104 RepID=UPI000C77F1B2|nr:site-specific integrase [Endozoicomonas acroporae]
MKGLPPLKRKITETVIKNMTSGDRVYDTDIPGFMAEKKKRGVVFNLRYRINGKRNMIKIGDYGALTVAQAREQAKVFAGDAARGIDPAEHKKKLREAAKAKPAATLRSFLHTEFLEVTPVKTAADIIPRVTRHFKEFLDKPLSEITPWQLEKWKRAFKGKASSCNRELTALRGVFSKAVNAGLLNDSPMPKVKKMKEDKNLKIRFLSSDEESKLFAAIEQRQEQQKLKRQSKIEWCIERRYEPPAPLNDQFTDHIKPIVILAINTGLRRGELFNLQAKDIDLHARILTVVGEGAKSGQTRHIPLNEKAFRTLVSWMNHIQPSTYVFPSPKTGKRLDNIASSWDKIRELSNLPDIRLHDLRHTFGTRLAHAGIDLVTIKELMGHEDLETTARYLHTNDQRKMSAVTKLE